jgi:hypothetical protein
MRLYPGWDESSWTGGTGNYKGDLEENMIVYLQDNYMVTRGTYYNKNVIWPEEKVTSEWIRFCNEELQFKIPEWTQTNKEIRVLSASEKEAIRKEKQEQLKVKLETAPTPLHGWDIVPDVLSEFNPTVELKVSYKTGQIKAGDLKNVNGILQHISCDIYCVSFCRDCRTTRSESQWRSKGTLHPADD